MEKWTWFNHFYIFTVLLNLEFRCDCFAAQTTTGQSDSIWSSNFRVFLQIKWHLKSICTSLIKWYYDKLVLPLKPKVSTNLKKVRILLGIKGSAIYSVLTKSCWTKPLQKESKPNFLFQLQCFSHLTAQSHIYQSILISQFLMFLS